MSDNKIKKMIVFSNTETKERIEAYVQNKCSSENQTQSKIIEELIMQSMTIDGV